MELESDPSSEEFKRRQMRGEEAWLREAAALQEPVPTHDVLFCEPITSKNSSEVLRAIQRVWVRILGLGFTVRRLHTDGGREFCNKTLDAWALARDLPHTYSIPSDPKSNGRIENWVKHAKAGVRTLICSDENKDTTNWPSALHQWTEQRLRKSLKLLHVPDPIRPLPPYGAQVVVKNRQWNRKTPHDAKAMRAKALCPAANIPNATVLLLENNQFYVAPVVYQNVREPVTFEGYVDDNIPPAPARRLRGKTTTIGRGESGDFGDDVPSGPLGGTESGGAGVCDGDDDEFEGMVPDAVLFEGSALEGGEIRNLWCERACCPLCENPHQTDSLGTCEGCGTWQGRTLSLQESEDEATRLLNGPNKIQRGDVNDLLRMSMQGWRARSRPCDREAGHHGTSGWTLGHYVYGSSVGITRETYRRPQLTRLLTKYIQQNVGLDATWTAIRVTCNYEAGPHIDRNKPGSRNMVVPISWFEGGQIWVEGVTTGDGQSQSSSRTIKGERRVGHHIGGSDSVACFDPRLVHAVEPAVGSRRVLVGYTPRLLERVPDPQKLWLSEHGFQLPEGNHQGASEEHKQEQNVGVSEEDGEGDTQESAGEEYQRPGFSPGGEGSNGAREMEQDWVMAEGITTSSWMEADHLSPELLDEAHHAFVQLRNIEMEARAPS